jgi:hypothetical protein
MIMGLHASRSIGDALMSYNCVNIIKLYSVASQKKHDCPNHVIRLKIVK